jgi:GTP-dependent phosphoenolpyruvate carboxykinase
MQRCGSRSDDSTSMFERDLQAMTTDTSTATEATTHQGILDFVNEVAAMTTPDRIHWCTGS